MDGRPRACLVSEDAAEVGFPYIKPQQEEWCLDVVGDTQSLFRATSEMSSLKDTVAKG